MKAPHNHLFVKVDSERNDEVVTKSGVKIFVPVEDYFQAEGDKSAPLAVKRHYGEVVGQPSQLTNQSKVRPKDPGLPNPGRYIPSDDIAFMKRNGVEVDSWASLNLFVHEWYTTADFEQEILNGDKVYFHFNTISPDNNVKYLKEKIYKLCYTNAICVVREGQIIPVAGHVLIEPLWEDGVEDLGDGKRGKLNKSGLVTELHDKPKYLEGKVTHVCKPLKGEEVFLEVGETIVYAKHADWEVEIEGKKYYVMRYWDILAKIEN